MAEQYAVGKKTLKHGIIWDVVTLADLDAAYAALEGLANTDYYQWVILTREGMGQWQETN